MSDASPEQPVFHIMESGIPQWVHASLTRQYADILDEPVPAELLALLMPEEKPATDAASIPGTSAIHPHAMTGEPHLSAMA